MAMNLTQLRSFHAVAEEGGFTRAAKALNVGQPTITTQIRELEQRYGVELFLRRGRKIELTEAGSSLLELSRRIFGLCADAEELLTSHGKLLRGELRFAAVGPFHATEIIATFMRRYPDIRVSMLLGNSWQTLSKIIDLSADVGILAHTADDPRIETMPYRSHEVVIFVNKTHPWFERNSVRLEELTTQLFLLREQGSTTRLALERALEARGLHLGHTLEIGSREGVWKAVEQGLGVSAVADFEFIAQPQLKTLRIEDCEIRTEYKIAYLADRAASRRINAFLEVCKAVRSRVPITRTGAASTT